MKLALINPNTSAHVTERMAVQARKTAGDRAEIMSITAAFGPRIISSLAENGLAVHGALDAAARVADEVDGIILGVSMDTGLRELRELLSIPVVGMAQSALVTGSTLGTRIGCVTIGPQIIPLYEDLTKSYGYGDCCLWQAVDVPGIFDEVPGPQVAEVLSAQCDAFVKDAGVDVLVLCGAVLTGYAPQVGAGLSVPVLDCIDTATRLAIMLTERAQAAPQKAAAPQVSKRASDGLGDALAALLARG